LYLRKIPFYKLKPESVANLWCMQLMELAQMSESTLPAVTRILFSKEDVLAREFIRAKMTDAGMEVT
jgi:hypothetical protein